MHVRLLFILAFSVLSGSNLASAAPGFWPLEHANVPEKVREAAQSVFQVFVPVASNFLIDFAKIEEAKQDLSKKRQLGQIVEPHYLLMLQELERCSKNENQHYFCTISVQGMGIGTAFSLGHQQIATALHNIVPFLERVLHQSEIKALSESQQFRFLKNVRIPVVIEEKVGQYKKVFLQINELTQQAFQFIKNRNNEKFFHQLYTDAVVLNVEGMEVGDGLKIAKSSAIDERLYALGFPEKTTDRLSHFNTPDADGNSLRVAIGQKKDFMHFFKELAEFKGEKEPAPLSKEEKTYVDRIHITASDSSVGMSGAPLLNADGQVVGLVHNLVLVGHSDVDKVMGSHSVSVCMKYLMRVQR